MLPGLPLLARITLIVWGVSLVSLGTSPAPSTAQPLGAPEPRATPSGLLPGWTAFERAWARVVAYSATVAVFDQKGTQVQNLLLDYTFRKPGSATVHVVKGPNAGATLVWNGGDAVIAHRGSGLLAMFTKSYSLHDPAVTTLRGSSIAQLSFAAIISHGQDTAGTASEA